MLVWRGGHRWRRIAWADLTHIAGTPRGVWFGARRDVVFLPAVALIARAEARGAAFAADRDPRALARALRARWLSERPEAHAPLAAIDRLERRRVSLRAVLVVALAAIGAYALEWADLLFLHVGAFEPALVARGEWWRIISGNFLHSLAPFHLVTTLVGLLAFGLLVERPLGSARTAVVMGAAAAAAMAASALAGYDRVVGGSGIVAGLAGATLALEMHASQRLPASWRIPRRLFLGALAVQAGFELALAFGGSWLERLGFEGPSIASAAHAGGFAAGYLVTRASCGKALGETRSALGWRLGALACAVLGAAGLACLAPFIVRSPGWLVAHSERILALERDGPLTLNNLAWATAVEAGAQGRGLEVARELAERAVAETQRLEATLLDTLAEIEFRSGEHERAIETIDEALALEPADPYLLEQRQRFGAGSIAPAMP